jgi:hypothetical protein
VVESVEEGYGLTRDYRHCGSPLRGVSANSRCQAATYIHAARCRSRGGDTECQASSGTSA